MLKNKNSKFLWLKNPEGFLNKKADVTITQLISLLLVVLVIAVVLVSIFKPQLWDWVRALPDYKYNDTDREIQYSELTDAELAGICPDASKIGFVGPLRGDLGFREQYINFIIGNQPRRTKLYWKGSETDAKIWLYQKDKYTGWDWFKKDLLVATVNKRVIKVEPILLDLESEIYQRTRFKGKILELSLLPYLENAYLAFNNQICRVGEPAKPKPAWPENVGGKLEYIDPSLAVNSGELDFIGIYPYINLKNSDVKFLYLKNKKDFIQVNGYREGWWGVDGLAPDREDLLEIYPDGSIWFIEGNALHYGISISNTKKEVLSRKNPFLFIDAANKWYGLETNLRIDYDVIRKKVEYKEKTD